MTETVKVRIQRVKRDDEATKPVSRSGFIVGVIPEDGFVVSVDGPGNIPLYVRDTDIEKARELRERKRKPVVIDAESWNGR